MTAVLELSKGLLGGLTARAVSFLGRSDGHASEVEVVDPITFQDLVTRHAFPLELNPDADKPSLADPLYVAEYLDYVGKYVSPSNEITPLVSHIEGVGNVLQLNIRFGPQQKTVRTEHVLRLSGTQPGDALTPEELRAGLDELTQRNIIDGATAEYLHQVHSTAYEQSLSAEGYRFKFDKGRGATLVDMSPWIAGVDDSDGSGVNVVESVIQMADQIRTRDATINIIETNGTKTAMLDVYVNPEDPSQGVLYSLPLLSYVNASEIRFVSADWFEAVTYFRESGIITPEQANHIFREFKNQGLDHKKPQLTIGEQQRLIKRQSYEQLQFLTRQIELPDRIDYSQNVDFNSHTGRPPETFTLERRVGETDGVLYYVVNLESIEPRTYPEGDREIKLTREGKTLQVVRVIDIRAKTEHTPLWEYHEKLQMVEAYIRFVDAHSDDIVGAYPENTGRYNPISILHGPVPDIIRETQSGNLYLVLPYGYNQIAHTAAFESSETLHHQTIIEVMRRCVRGIEEELRTNP